MYIADLHIHSKYSRATSRDCDAPHLDLWARRKGIGLVGTGDFTHPQWRAELTEALEPAEEGLYRLRDECAMPCDVAGGALSPRFVLSGEISTIYKKDGKTRKVHHVILLPSLEAAEELAHRLEAVGNLHSDGRPILGMDSRDLLALTLEACPQAIFIPAHIWTPHFSLFGAFSCFQTLEECYGDLSPWIHALETGLSSDPPMNRRVSQLDGYTLVSNSDAHSPAKLGRECNLIDGERSYPALKRAIETGEGFLGTVEFFPEEGKYHLDGHRNCHCRLEPEETERLGGRCPVCGRKLTVGVLHRVEELADRATPLPDGKAFESLMPLPELLGNCLGCSPTGKKAQEAYFAMLRRFGPELSILRELKPEEAEAEAGFAVGEALRRLRAGRVNRVGGYDGEYGTITLFAPGELERLGGQTSLFELAGASTTGGKLREASTNEACTLRERNQDGLWAAEQPAEPFPASAAQETAGSYAAPSAALQNASPAAPSASSQIAPSASSPAAPSASSQIAPPASSQTAPSASSQIAQSASSPAAPPAALNPRQCQAVASLAPVVAVVAGPGTGKTKTLVERVAYLMEERGVSPAHITAVTFTRQAAQEMKERLAQRLGGAKSLRGFTVGTFHAIALTLLPKKPILSREQAAALMGEVLEQRGDKLSVSKALQGVSALKNGLPAALPPGLKEAYEARVQAWGSRDLDDVLTEALTVDTKGMKRFDYLLVDEYQDINALQRQLTEQWSRHGKSLFVIGDPDQSIYGFRGADAACFDRLLRSHPGAEAITLEENYRSAASVLDCALAVIAHNGGQPRTLRACRGEGAKARVVLAEDAFSEGVWIAKEIGRMAGGVDMVEAHAQRSDRAEARAFSEIAVLCRTHRQLEQIEYCLIHDDIPCVICGREDFWQDGRVRGLLGFFRWLLNPADAPGLRDALHYLWKCPQPLRERAQAASSQMEVLNGAALREALGGFAPLLPWLDAAEALLPLIKKEKPRKLLEELAKRMQTESKPVERLLNAAVFHSRMDAFLESVLLGEEADVRRRSGASYQSGAVRLTTLHGAKGLEFPVVFLAGVARDQLPLCRQDRETDVEEERRLFFVGLTRARDELIVTCGGEPSAFLAELPSALRRQQAHSYKAALKTEQLRLC